MHKIYIKLNAGFSLYDVGEEVNAYFGTANTTITDEDGNVIQNPNLHTILPNFNGGVFDAPDGFQYCQVSMETEYYNGLMKLLETKYVPTTCEILSEPPTWEVPATDADGNPIMINQYDEDGNVTGKVQATQTVRIPMVA